MDSMNIEAQIFGWDFEWTLKMSNNQTHVNELIAQMENNISSGEKKHRHYVILLHDYLFKNNLSIENLNYFINTLKKDNKAQFNWIQEYPVGK